MQHLPGLLAVSALFALGACADAPSAPVVQPPEVVAARTLGFTIRVIEATGPIVPLAINASGVVVGRAFTPTQSAFHAFRWRRGALVDLAPDAANNSQATALDDDGDIVGWSQPIGGGYGHAVLWRRGVRIELGSFGGNFSYASGVNDRGEVVGWSDVPSSELPPFLWPPSAFVWRRGVMTRLASLPGAVGSLANGINPAGDVVGWSYGSIYQHSAVVWRKGVPTSLVAAGGPVSEAIAINPRGDVVGWSAVPGAAGQHAVLWHHGAMTDLGTLGGTSSNPTAINARGDVVGWSETASGEIHAFLWSKGVMTDLAPDDPTSFAEGINAAGDVTGTITRAGRILGVIWERR